MLYVTPPPREDFCWFTFIIRSGDADAPLKWFEVESKMALTSSTASAAAEVDDMLWPPTVVPGSSPSPFREPKSRFFCKSGKVPTFRAKYLLYGITSHGWLERPSCFHGWLICEMPLTLHFCISDSKRSLRRTAWGHLWQDISWYVGTSIGMSGCRCLFPKFAAADNNKCRRCQIVAGKLLANRFPFDALIRDS